MANPRNILDYEGIDGAYATFRIDGVTIVFDADEPGGAAGVGRAVTIGANETVELAADADRILGKLVLVEADGKCNVQIRGGMKLPGGEAATLTPGASIVGALGPGGALGYIRAMAAAEPGRGFILDASDTAAVDVYL